MSNKTLEDVAKESANAVASCVAYYTDSKLPQDVLDMIQRIVLENLQVDDVSQEWKDYAEQYQQMVEAE